MAISQGRNLINVVVHSGADSRSTSLSTITLSHVLVGGKKKTGHRPTQIAASHRC